MDKLYISNFLGGINESIDEMLIKYNESPECKNCYTDNGNLETIKGYTKYIDHKFNSAIDSMIPSYINNNDVLVSTGGKLYKIVNNTPVEIANSFTNGDFDFLNFQVGNDNVVIFGNGKDNMKVYDGVAVKNVLNRRPIYNTDGTIFKYVDANGVEHNSESTITTLAPKCKFIELHYDRIWGAGDEEFPDRLYFSTAGVNGSDIHDWTFPIEEGEANQHGGFEEMPTWDGGKIIGLKVVFDDLVIFKNKQIYKIFGNYPGNYQKVLLFNSEGAISDKSIVACGKGSFFLNIDGIYHYDGTNVSLISDKIKKIIGRINKDKIGNSVAIYSDNKYYLAVPLDNSNENNAVIIFDTNIGKYDIIEGVNANDFIEFNNSILFCSNNGYIYKLNEGTTFDGTNINMSWKSYVYSKNKNSKKITDYIYFIGKGNGNVSIKCITDKKIKEKIVPLTETEKPYRVRLNNSGRILQLQIENVDGSYVCIKQPELTFEVDED